MPPIRGFRLCACLAVTALFILSSVSITAEGKRKPNPGFPPDGIFGSVYSWRVSHDDYSPTPMNDVVIALAPYDNPLFYGPDMALHDGWDWIYGGGYEIPKPSFGDDGAKYWLRIWYNPDYVGEVTYYTLIRGGYLIYESTVRLSSEYSIWKDIQTDVARSQGNLPTAAVMFDSEAENCCISKMEWAISAGNSRTHKTAVTVGANVLYGDASYDKTWSYDISYGQGPVTNFGSSMIGNRYVGKTIVPVIWPEEKYLQFADFTFPGSDEFGIKPLIDPMVFSEQFAKQQYNSGNKFGPSAWIPREDWLNAVFPFSLRFMSRDTMSSETWTLGMKLDAWSSFGGVTFKMQQSWSNWDGFSMRWEALLDHDPGSDYAGILVWVPHHVVDDLGATIYEPYNTMYVYLCTTPP